MFQMELQCLCGRLLAVTCAHGGKSGLSARMSRDPLCDKSCRLTTTSLQYDKVISPNRTCWSFDIEIAILVWL